MFESVKINANLHKRNRGRFAGFCTCDVIGLDMKNSIQSGAMAHRETFNLTDIFRKEDNCGFF